MYVNYAIEFLRTVLVLIRLGYMFYVCDSGAAGVVRVFYWVYHERNRLIQVLC